MKRIALIVIGTALLVASCGIASAARKTEGTMPNHLILPYPAEHVARPQNTVSPEQLVARAEHVARPQYTVSPEQLVARAEHVARPQYTVSPEQLVARAEHVARPRKHATKPTSPVIVPQAPTGFGTAACSDTDYRDCSGVGPLSPRLAEQSAGSVGSGSRAVVSQTNVPQ